MRRDQMIEMVDCIVYYGAHPAEVSYEDSHYTVETLYSTDWEGCEDFINEAVTLGAKLGLIIDVENEMIVDVSFIRLRWS